MRAHTRLCAPEQGIQDLGHLWCIIQEHEALAHLHMVRGGSGLIQADEQAQHLEGAERGGLGGSQQVSTSAHYAL